MIVSNRISVLLFASVLTVVACGDDETAGGGGSGGSGASGSGASGGAGGSGATGTTGGTGGGTNDPASLDVSWTIRVQGEVRDCYFANASYVDLELTPATGTPQTVRFNCDDGSGEAPNLAAGEYTVTPKLVSFGEQVVATGDAQSVTLAAGATEDAALDFALPGAMIAASWSITQNGNPATCMDAGAHRVEILASTLSGVTYGNTFECTDGQGTTNAFPLDTYEVVVSLMYEQDVVLVSSDVIPATLDVAGETVTLEPLVFALTLPNE